MPNIFEKGVCVNPGLMAAADRIAFVRAIDDLMSGHQQIPSLSSTQFHGTTGTSGFSSASVEGNSTTANLFFLPARLKTNIFINFFLNHSEHNLYAKIMALSSPSEQA